MHKIGASLVLEEGLQRPQLQRCHGEVALVLHLGLFEQQPSWVSPGISASSPHIWTPLGLSQLQSAQQRFASTALTPMVCCFSPHVHCAVLILKNN